MSKITRAIMKIFGETGGSGEFGQFGSNAASPPGTTTKDIEQIQGLSQYSGGWYDATADAAEPPRIQDRNGLDLLFSTQLAYLFQSGIPEWLDSADQRYYADVSLVTRSGGIYLAILGDDGANINSQLDPLTNPLWWTLVWQKPAVEAWDTAEAVAYDTAGVVVERYGRHYTSTGLTGNAGKDPLDPANKDYWYPSPGVEKLEEIAKKGMSQRGGMHKVNDVEDADYSTSLLLDKATFGSTTYEFYRVALDGSVITGDATLEAIFDPGGAAEYPFIDLYAPDDLGTRTLKDGRGTYNRAMTAAGGEAATRGERQEDQMQRITGSITTRHSLMENAIGAFTNIQATTNTRGAGTDEASSVDFDSANSPNARTSATTGGETRVKGIVEGVGYIVVMVAA